MLVNDIIIKEVEYSKEVLDNRKIMTAVGVSYVKVKYEFKFILNTGKCILLSVTTNVYDYFRPNRKLMWWKIDSPKKIRFILEYIERNNKLVECHIEKFSRDNQREEREVLQRTILHPNMLYFSKNLINKLNNYLL